MEVSGKSWWCEKCAKGYLISLCMPRTFFTIMGCQYFTCEVYARYQKEDKKAWIKSIDKWMKSELERVISDTEPPLPSPTYISWPSLVSQFYKSLSQWQPAFWKSALRHHSIIRAVCVSERGGTEAGWMRDNCVISTTRFFNWVWIMSCMLLMYVWHKKD